MGKHKIALDLLEVLAAHPSKKQRIFGPAKEMKRSAAARPSTPKPFTKADAKALYHQIQDFEKEYRDEGYKVPNNLSPSEVEIAMARGTLHFRIREIRATLYRNFYADPVPSLPAAHPTALDLAEYRETLTTVQAFWHQRQAAIRRAAESARSRRQAARAARREAAADADREAGVNRRDDAAVKRAELARRRKWYRIVKPEMRCEGYWVARGSLSPGAGWQPPLVDVPGSWVLPDHVQSDADMRVYLNQLGILFTPLSRRPRA